MLAWFCPAAVRCLADAHNARYMGHGKEGRLLYETLPSSRDDWLNAVESRNISNERHVLCHKKIDEDGRFGEIQL